MTETLQDKSIQEELRDAKVVEIPSELKKDTIIESGDVDLGGERMTVTELSNAGYIYVWDTRTFERAPVLSYMLPAKLRDKRPDGSFIWTTNDPKRLPKRGTLKCYLHKDSPEREEFDKMGLRVCKKSNIINVFEVKQHMIKKHPKEYQAIEDVRKEKERQEDRADTKLMREALTRNIGVKTIVEEKPPLYVSNKDKKLK